MYLAPMAGVTDLIFRRICKQMGADVMVTEFVSAEGIIQADDRTRKYTEFDEGQRPVGVQLFGADGVRMGEAARKIIDKGLAGRIPDFIDINFGCPVNKVVSRNGGSSLLRDCPLLAEVAGGVAKAVGMDVPVTAKIRIGWDADSVNAVEVARTLEDCGMQAIAVHGRTRAQGYSGEADWETIDAVARAVSVPVIGNGDISCGEDLAKRKRETAVSGVMIGRAAMQNPWVFREAKHFLATGEVMASVPLPERWELGQSSLSTASNRLEWADPCSGSVNGVPATTIPPGMLGISGTSINAAKRATREASSALSRPFPLMSPTTNGSVFGNPPNPVPMSAAKRAT